LSIEWLEELETRVRDATERLRELRDENQSLQDRIQELETKLSAAGGTGAEPEEWQRERDEIRERVERLTRHLEGLVGD
jgi:chromosome segregation ATPase